MSVKLAQSTKHKVLNPALAETDLLVYQVYPVYQVEELERVEQLEQGKQVDQVDPVNQVEYGEQVFVHPFICSSIHNFFSVPRDSPIDFCRNITTPQDSSPLKKRRIWK
jgi:hypothetical protein